MRKFELFGILLSFLFGSNVVAAPPSLVYQGRLLRSDGTPLEYSNVSFIFQVTDPSGACVVYQEQVTGYNMVNSGGVFDVPIGAGTVQYPLGGASGVLDAFNNSNSFSCGVCSLVSGSYTCVDGSNTYSASVGDARKLRVQFYDGSGWKVISPDSVIRSVPYAGYALSAQKLGTSVATDFILKTGIPTCTSGTFLSWNGSALTCAPVIGASGGTVTNVSSANAYLTISNNTSTPQLTLNVGTTANTIAAGNDSRLVNAIQTGAGASGDLSGIYPGPTVVALQGVSISPSAPTSGQFLKFNGTSWGAATIGIPDVSGLNASLSSYLTQSAFNGYVSSASCAANQAMYWNSVGGSFQCQAINVGLAGDVTGSIGAAKVIALQSNPVDATPPTSNQVLQWNGTKWAPTTFQASDLSGAIPATNMPAFSGDVTSSAGSTTLTLSSVGTAGTYYKVTTDVKGRVTSGVSSLVAADIPNLDWSKIATGKPTTLTGYGITDSLVSNAGGTPSIQTGTDASKPVSPSAGAIYFATDTNKIYQYNSGAWAVIASSAGSGGTIAALTGDVTASGGGSVAATVASVGGSTAANVHSAELAANAATNAYTASTIVKRDASGNFSAGTVTASLTGAASLNVLKAGDSMSGNLTFAANTGNIYTGGSGSNTVTVEGPSGAIGTSYVLRLPTAQGSANQLMINDGSGNLSWISLSSLGVSSVSVTSPITNSGSASAPNIGIQQATTSQSGYLSSTDWNTFNSKQGTALNSANIWVGNGSDVATAVSPGGDVTMTNAGSFTVAKIQGTSVNPTAPSSTGQVLRYDGTKWTPNFVSMFDLRSTITGTQAFGGVGCSAGQTLTWTAATDNLSCSNIAISGAQVTYSSQAANTFFASPNGGAGSPTFRSIASADLPTSGVTAGTYKSVTVDAYGRVTAGTTPTTAAGYGITDALVNGGNSFGAAATLGTNDANMLAFKTSNSTRVTIDTSGNVGIGTTSPANNLQVGTTTSTSTASPITLSLGGTYSNTAGGHPKLKIWDGGAGANGIGVSAGYLDYIAATSNGHEFFVNGNVSPTLMINSSGNVGIGTASPTSTLQVNGETQLTTLNQGSSTTERFYPNVISQAQNTTVNGAWIIHSPMTRTSSNLFKIRVHGYAYGVNNSIDFTVVGYANSAANGSSDSQPGAIIHYNLSDMGTDGLAKYVGIDANGKVAIALGTTSLSAYYYRITVDAWITNTTTDYASGWSIDQNTTSGFNWLDFHGPLTNNISGYLAVTSSGNVGIGTTSPTVSLDVNGAVRAGSSATVTSCGSGQANGEGSQRYNYTSHSMEYCNGTAWVSLSNSGVGAVFGGAYEYYVSGNSSCSNASAGVKTNNPLTGGQSCPAGFSSYVAFSGFDNTNTNCLVICYK